MILAADIGATNTRVGLFSADGNSPVLVSSRRFINRDFANLDAVFDEFVPASCKDVATVSLGVAGLVINGRVHITNLGWDIDSSRLRARFDGATVALLNDVEATAYGLASLSESDVVVLNPGKPIVGAPKALIASGTGLGEAVVYSHGNSELVVASEAGHADFAPAQESQVQLLNYLWQRFTPVSWDRVLSGPGLGFIYEFFRDKNSGKELAHIAAQLRTGDAGAAIAGAALRRECELCCSALDLFVAIYGSEAGNHALRTLSLGGVYLGGGIAPKIVAKLRDVTFMQAFCHKDRMEAFMSSVPVYVIMNEETALLGAARYAHSRE
ncbi:MAG TPA: glucokinase [Terriglobales bacterium]|nr:glucokinase [Terriglobales bacterium]